jgi:hypothetical protein
VLLGRLLGRGLSLRVRCSEPCTAHLALRRHGRALTVPVIVSLAAQVPRRVRLQPSRAARGLLRRRASAAAVLSGRAVDPAGNSRTLSLGMRVTG